MKKPRLFNDILSKQCTPLTTSSALPPLNLLADKTIDHISMQCDERISLIRNLNHNEVLMEYLVKCYSYVTTRSFLTLKIIFENILVTSFCPGIWKLANVSPIFKKGDKQLIKIYRPISLLPICGKLFVKYLKTYSIIFTANNLILFNNLHSKQSYTIQ